MKKKMPHLPGAGRLLVLLLLAGCNTVTTTVQTPPTAGGSVPVGIPYFLPQGNVSFSFALKKTAEGKFDTLDFTAETKLVPDHRHVFLLQDGGGLFTRTNRKLALEDGLLTSLQTENEGQAGEAVKALAAIWLNTLQITALRGGLAADAGLLEAVAPKAAAVLGMPLSSDTEKAMFRPPQRAVLLRKKFPELRAMTNIDPIVSEVDSFLSDAMRAAPERMLSTATEQETMITQSVTNQRIVWLASENPAHEEDYGRFFSLVTSTEAGTPATAGDGESNLKSVGGQPQPGIYVRVPVPVNYKVLLLVKPRELYLDRLANLDTELGDTVAQLAKDEPNEAAWQTQLGEAKALVRDGPGRLSALRESRKTESDSDKYALIDQKIADLADELKTADVDATALSGKLKALKTTRKHQGLTLEEIHTNLALLYNLVSPEETRLPQKADVVFQRETAALLPSAYAVNLPLKDAILGKTTHGLTFSRGVLTGADLDSPAALVEALKIPLDLTDAVITSLTKLVQLKISLANNQKDLAKAASELDQARQDMALSKLEQDKKEAGFRADLSDSQAKIKENEKKIATLEKEIAKTKEP